MKYLSGVDDVGIAGTISLDTVHADSEACGDTGQRVTRSYYICAACGGGGGAASAVTCPVAGVYYRWIPARYGDVPPILPEHTYILPFLDDDTIGDRRTGLWFGRGLGCGCGLRLAGGGRAAARVCVPCVQVAVHYTKVERSMPVFQSPIACILPCGGEWPVS